jgi:folate-binding protein YgfZ
MTNSSTVKERSLIYVKGEDALSFLQGIMSGDISKCQESTLKYCYFLSPQGRVYTDVFIQKVANGFALDICNQHIDFIIARLKMYKLRAKVEISLSDELVSVAHEGGLVDPRDENLGCRVYGAPLHEDENFLQAYHGKRIDLRIPDCGMDMIFERSLPMELRGADLGGISFTKGCYVGQEVTSRMHHRNAVKKSVYKIAFAHQPQPFVEIVSGEAKVGITLGCQENYGLALLNIEQIQDIQYAYIRNTSERIEIFHHAKI